MSETFDIVGKKKKIVDASAYLSLPRSLGDGSKLSSGVSNTYLGGDYFSTTADNSPGEVDKVRAALGKNWDFRKRSDASPVEFSNNWEPPEIFYDKPVELEYCDPTPTNIPADSGFYAGSDLGLSEELVLNTRVLANETNNNPSLGELLYDQSPTSWLHYVKIGRTADNPMGRELYPLVRTDHYYYDHFHETSVPFTPDELLSKQPAGKTFFANYSTYYNERINSSNYENSLLTSLDIHNSIPSIYGFLRLLGNKEFASSPYFDSSLLQTIDLGDDLLAVNSYIRQLIKDNPLEELISIIGHVGDANPDIFAKIINSNLDNIDADSLFEEYFDTWSDQISRPVATVARPLLEKKFNNLIFSPQVLQTTNLMEKYKPYFPYYCQIEFTAKLLTSIGDLIKSFFMTKFFSDVISSMDSPVIYDAQGNLITISNPSPNALWETDIIDGAIGKTTHRVIEYSEENIYDNLVSSGDYIGNIEYSERSISEPMNKRFINLDIILFPWMHSQEQSDNLFAPNADDIAVEDIATYLRNDFSEPIDLDSESNALWKSLFGGSFKSKLIDTYNDKRRSFKDIMEGQQAYTEDIFYKITKSVKLAGTDVFTPIQNVLIPNTSELDVVKFIDTQLKYETAATYKYDVYALRIVFGSKYRYMWINEFGSYDNVPQQFVPGVLLENDIENGYGISADQKTMTNIIIGAGTIVTPIETDLGANLKVEVQPSIRLIQDKVFSTPEILIMDKPPVTPDINIIPYRAVNNKVKILLSANVDRYRETPIILLDEDVQEFDKVKAAQLSFDGKVEFGSDNPTTRFQIFRTQTKPTAYSDFELYQDINSSVYEEGILPNTKYYYTFRAVDAHNHISNPTPVYEVELIDEKGAVKPIIRTISMEQKQNKTNVKEAQKYIYIKPSQQQLFFSEDPEVDSAFSSVTKKKKYKMRLISKGSGKKIDINFSLHKKPQNET